MEYESIFFSGHAVGRVFERAVSAADVESVLRAGEDIADYPDDRPHPSRLVLGFVQGRPLHVVAALDAASDTCHVVSVYEPDPALWEEGFKKRRSR